MRINFIFIFPWHLWLIPCFVKPNFEIFDLDILDLHVELRDVNMDPSHHMFFLLLVTGTIEISRVLLDSLKNTSPHMELSVTPQNVYKF
jgi:hypothetical protein